jgi:hypothetical protein
MWDFWADIGGDVGRVCVRKLIYDLVDCPSEVFRYNLPCLKKFGMSLRH